MADNTRILLYTAAAEIDDRTLAEMIGAGILPVKVTSLDAARFLATPADTPEGHLSAALTAALQLMTEHPSSEISERFGPRFAALLRAAEGSDGR